MCPKYCGPSSFQVLRRVSGRRANAPLRVPIQSVLGISAKHPRVSAKLSTTTAVEVQFARTESLVGRESLGCEDADSCGASALETLPPHAAPPRYGDHESNRLLADNPLRFSTYFWMTISGDVGVLTITAFPQKRALHAWSAAAGLQPRVHSPWSRHANA